MNAPLLIIIFLVFLTGKNNCEKLEDGDYLVKHTLNGTADYRLTIKHGKYSIQTDDSKVIKGEVKWIDECSLKLEPKVYVKQDTSIIKKFTSRLENHLSKLKVKSLTRLFSEPHGQLT